MTALHVAVFAVASIEVFMVRWALRATGHAHRLAIEARRLRMRPEEGGVF